MVIKDTSLIDRVIFPKSIIEEKFKKGAKILDIGCATGLFLKKCDQYKLKTFGLDYSKKLIKIAQKNTKARLHCGSAEDLSLYKDNFFDVITVFDVIEHLPSPHTFLSEAYRVLKPKGKIILTTPNLNSLGRLIMGKRWHGYSDKTHLYLFTPESLAFSLESAGFKIKKLESPFHPFPKFVQSFVNRLGMGGQIWLVAKK